MSKWNNDYGKKLYVRPDGSGLDGTSIQEFLRFLELNGQSLGGGGSTPDGDGTYYKNEAGDTIAIPLLDNNVVSMSPADILTSRDVTHAVTGQNFNGATTFTFASGANVVSSVINTPTSATVVTRGTVNGAVSMTASVGGDAEGSALTPRVYTDSVVPGDGTTSWDNTANVTTGDGFIGKTGGAAAWDSGGTFGSIPAANDFNFGITLYSEDVFAGTSANSIIGLVASYVDANWTDTQYGIYLGASGRSLTTVENGAIGSQISTYVPGDRIEFKRVGTVMTLSKNDAVIHTFADASSEALIPEVNILSGAEPHTAAYLKYGAGSNA